MCKLCAFTNILKKYTSILILLIFVSCLESKEDRIIRKLNSELEIRGLEIDTIITHNTTEIIISPKENKEMATVVPVNEFSDVENQDSLDILISIKANKLEAWYALPEWNDKRDIFSPWLRSNFDDLQSEIYKQQLTPSYILTFNHTNTKTHRIRTIGERLLNHWGITKREFKDWSWKHLNLLYDQQAKLVKTNFKEREILQLKCHSEHLQHTLVFSESFKKEASKNLDYPFYIILNKNFPVYLSKKEDLEFLKENLAEIESKTKQSDLFPTELLTYTKNGIEVSEIE